MKLVFKIAKTELKNLFFSPVAWFLTVIFLVICAMFYGSSIAGFANLQDSLVKTTPSFKGFPSSLTADIFMIMKGNGFMGNVFKNLYLFIPLLTMGLINREFSSATIKLLYSSPVKINKIVWGKYLAIMLYNLLLLSIVLLFMIVGNFSIKDIDWGHMTAGLMGFYLVVCSYTAIGMFMSSVSQYQIVSAIATFILLYALQLIGTLWQDYDFVRELTYFLSINGRAETMVAGLVTTRDVMYYVLISIMFVTFSYLSLLHGREMVSKVTKFARYAGVLALVLTFGYLTSRPGYVGYWDATRNDVNTIKEPTQDIISKMQDGELEVTLYTNLLGEGFAKSRPSQQNTYIWKVWDPYIRFKPNIKFDYVHYYDIKDGDSSYFKRMPNMTLDSIAKEYAKVYEVDFDDYLKPAAIRSQLDLQSENVRTVMLLKYKGKSIFLRTFSDIQFWPDEEHFAAALKRLCNDTIPKVYVSTGNYERSIEKRGEREYSNYSILKASRRALINHGYVFDTVNLHQQDVPADANALVLADPKVELSEVAISRLNNYISTGGNLLITGEPGKQHVVNPVTEPLGVKLMPGTLVQLSKNETPDKITPYMSMDYTWLIAANSPWMSTIRDSFKKGDSLKKMHPGVAHLEYMDKGFKAHRMWVTGPKGLVWVKQGHLVTDSAAPVLVEAAGDYRLDSFNVAVSLERKVGNKDQRITIVGDADFLSNRRAASHFAGQDYLSWMNHEAYGIRLFRKPYADDLLTINQPTAKAQKVILLYILPGLVILFGTLLILRRNRR